MPVAVWMVNLVCALCTARHFALRVRLQHDVRLENNVPSFLCAQDRDASLRGFHSWLPIEQDLRLDALLTLGLTDEVTK